MSVPKIVNLKSTLFTLSCVDELIVFLRGYYKFDSFPISSCGIEEVGEL
jgi:hypothetical protein